MNSSSSSVSLRVFLMAFLSISLAACQRARDDENQLIASIRAKLELDASSDLFAGAVLLAKNDRTIFAGAYGLADRERKIPNRLDTRFRLGSMNKMFTAVSILQLVEAGKVGLHDRLGVYLSDYPNKDLASRVTLHHLLTHTGGTGDVFGPEYRTHRMELRALKDYVTLYGNRDVEFDPGSRFRYSNYGFVLLGVVIERVSGQDYYDYVRDHIYMPAGMTSTDSLPEDVPVPDRAIGYHRSETDDYGLHPNSGFISYRGTSAGGGYSTVQDLHRFAMALMSNYLLNAKDTHLLTTHKAGPSAGYAYGFGDNDIDGVRFFGHDGGAPGVNGVLRVYPQSGYVIAVLSNRDPPTAARVAEFIGARLGPSPNGGR